LGRASAAVCSAPSFASGGPGLWAVAKRKDSMAEINKELWRAAIEAFEGGAHSVLEFVCLRLLEREPDNFAVRMLLAHALLKMKRFTEASALLEGADPDDERTIVLWHRTAGDYYAERGDHEAAEDEYATALALSEVQPSDLVLDLVETRLQQGNNEAALRAVDAFVTHRPAGELDDSELLAYAKARALRNLGRFEEALVSAREAATLADGFEAGTNLVDELEQRLAWTARLELVRPS
jgi:tetratricopeptide (TPR) repeat protein